MVSYYDLLISQQQRIQTELDLTECQSKRLFNTIAFYQAMGGGEYGSEDFFQIHIIHFQIAFVICRDYIRLANNSRHIFLQAIGGNFLKTLSSSRRKRTFLIIVQTVSSQFWWFCLLNSPKHVALYL